MIATEQNYYQSEKKRIRIILIGREFKNKKRGLQPKILFRVTLHHKQSHNFKTAQYRSFRMTNKILCSGCAAHLACAYLVQMACCSCAATVQYVWCNSRKHASKSGSSYADVSRRLSHCRHSQSKRGVTNASIMHASMRQWSINSSVMRASAQQ